MNTKLAKFMIATKVWNPFADWQVKLGQLITVEHCDFQTGTAKIHLGGMTRTRYER